MVEIRALPTVAELAKFAVTPRTVEELSDHLQTCFPSLDLVTLSRHVDDLEACEFLISETCLVRPGCEPTELAAVALEHGDDDDLLACLGGLQKLEQRPIEPSAVGGDTLDAWATALQFAPALSSIKRPDRFHVDLEYANVGGQIDSRTATELVCTAQKLQEIAPPSKDQDLVERLRDRFEDAEVPLLLALDPDRGILRHPERIASRLAFDAGIGPSSEVPEIEPPPPAALAALSTWIADGSTPDLKDLDLETTNDQTRHAMLIVANLLSESSGFLATFDSADTRGSHSMTARFLLSRDEVEDSARAMAARADLNLPENVVTVEIVSSTGDAADNISLRPKLSQLQFDVFGSGGGEIRLSDVNICVDNGSIWLRHAPTGKWLVPSLNSAVNVHLSSTPIVVRFLADLANRAGGIMWNWGCLKQLSHLPRVTHGKILVSPERWRIERSVLRECLASREPQAQLRRHLHGSVGREWFGIADDDQVLPFRLDSELAIRAAFERSSRGSGSIVIIELPHLEYPAVHSRDGRHVAEVLLPVERRGKVDNPPQIFAAAVDEPWISLHLYGGEDDADSVLAEIAVVVEELRAQANLERWFFVRYVDPEPHLRVRFLATNSQGRVAIREAMESAVGSLRRSGKLIEFSERRYNPEVARYGGPATLELCQELFEMESDFIAGSLATTCPSNESRLAAVMEAIIAWSVLMVDRPLDFVRGSIDAYWAEFDRFGSNQIGKFWNSKRESLRPPSGYDDFIDDSSAVIVKIAQCVSASGLEGILGGLCRSLVHMHANRWQSVDQRRDELLSYELARRAMTSRPYSGRDLVTGSSPEQ